MAFFPFQIDNEILINAQLRVCHIAQIVPLDKPIDYVQPSFSEISYRARLKNALSIIVAPKYVYRCTSVGVRG